MSFLAIPAIDVRGGRVVRLNQGDYDRETVYGDSPAAIGAAYADAGSTWLHLVDLDAAKIGAYTLLPLLGILSRRLNVQTGGGIRSEADVETLLAAGASRVVVSNNNLIFPRSPLTQILATARRNRLEQQTPPCIIRTAVVANCFLEKEDDTFQQVPSTRQRESIPPFYPLFH